MRNVRNARARLTRMKTPRRLCTLLAWLISIFCLAIYLSLKCHLSFLHQSKPCPSVAEQLKQTDVAVIVSCCNEPKDAFAAIERNVDEIRAIGLVVKVSYYCKCSVRDLCTFHLPNVGRESHSYLWHIAHTYDSLASTTVFINAGFESKSHARAAARKIFSELMDNSGRVKTEGHDFYSDQHKMSWVNNRLSITLAANCSIVQDHCSLISNWCNISDLPCSQESKCACDKQTNCSWVGLTRENPNTLNGYLEPALNKEGEEHSMFTWSCDKLGVHPLTIQQCGYSWSAVFAAGRNRLRRLPKHVYLQLLREFDLYGANGGIAGHYLERLWCTMYLC